MPSSSSPSSSPHTRGLEVGGGFEATLLESRPGFVLVLFEGKGARKLFAHESGGHRWQRIPPNEKHGRVQTSTVTVAVLDPDGAKKSTFNQKEFEREVTIKKSLGTGPGGQHRNKTESCVTATHRPTGMSVRVDMRSQNQSLAMALRILAARIDEGVQQRDKAARDADRRAQVGSGMRGDKIRTYRTQDDRITDHRTGGTFSLKGWLRGDW